MPRLKLKGVDLVAFADQYLNNYRERDLDPRCVKVSMDYPCKLKVGDVVRLNDRGLEQCFGHVQGLSHMKTKTFTISEVAKYSITYPEPTYPVEINDKELNRLLLDDVCFDFVHRPVQPQYVAWGGDDRKDSWEGYVKESAMEYRPGVVNFNEVPVGDSDEDLI